MSLCTLPNDVILILLAELELEDQFRLSMTCQHFQFIIRSDLICRITLRERAPFSAEYQGAEAHKTGNYAMAWRRLVKRRVAVQTASPFHFSVVGAAAGFILANGALIYKPSPGEIRMLLLDGSGDDEIHIDPRRLAMEANPQLPWPLSRLEVDPLHHSNGIASFIVQTGGQNQLIFCNVKQKRILGTEDIERINSVFARNNKEYLYYGCRQKLPGNRWIWTVRGYNLHSCEWMAEQRLPSDFSGTDFGRDVCFEIFDGYLYGVSSATVPGELDTPNELGAFYSVFRIKLGDSSPSSRQDLPKRFSWRRPWNQGCVDLRYNDLKLVKDEETGHVFIYEIRKEWTPTGHTERNCYRREISDINFCAEESVPTLAPDGWLSDGPGLEAHVGTLRGGEVHHIGDSGLDLGRGDHGRLYAQAYHAASRTFVDMIGSPSASESGQERLQLRVRPMAPYSDDNPSVWSLRGGTSSEFPQVRFWPPEPTPGRHDPNLNLLRTLMNPRKGPIEEFRWAADESFFVFSPIVKGTSQSSALILVSFDPKLRLHGLRKADGSPEHPVREGLADKALHLDPTARDWASEVQPFYLAIKSPDGRRYGFDMTQ